MIILDDIVRFPRSHPLFGEAIAPDTLFPAPETNFLRQARSQSGDWEREERERENLEIGNEEKTDTPLSTSYSIPKTNFMTILDEIIQYKRNIELPKIMEKRELAEIKAESYFKPKPRDFVAALRRANGVALIAEIKKASPSKGVLRADFDPINLAKSYAQNGASAISILTDARYFQGQLDYLTEIRDQFQTLKHPQPLLRKDFIFDPYQVHEARTAGADAILLIAAVLKDQEMADLLALARKLNLTALIEVHNKAELDRVLPLKPRLIGVNNRDLRDFSVDLNTCIELRQHVPAEICFVAESGIHTAADVTRLAQEGVDAVLVGEAIVKSKNVGRKVRELAGRGV